MKKLGTRMASKAQVVASGRALETKAETYRGLRPIPEAQLQLPNADGVRYWIMREMTPISLDVAGNDGGELHGQDRGGTDS